MSDPSEPEVNRAFDAARFRQVLGHFPTGVTVVTAADGEQPVGLAVGSFTSVSLEPPLVAFCPAKTSSSWPKIRAAGHFCVNILAEDQEDVCRAFASKATDKFEGLGWRRGTKGVPILTDVLAWIVCHIDAVHDAGDHEVVIGRVIELEVEKESGPLVFYRGGYGRFSP
ncbi:MAG: flavin reductase family protein [Actinomycetota bacterium]